MKSFSDYLQALVAVIGALIQLIVLVRKYRQREKDTVARPGGIIGTEQDLLDLSFVLLFASLGSFLLTHSLLISGRIVSLGPLLIVEATAIATIVSALLYFAYRQGKTVLAIGVLSSATLLILLVAPGGPFRELPQGAEAAPDLLWPCLLLLGLSSAAFFYEYGGPFARGTVTTERIIATCGVVCIAIVASAAVGIQAGAHLDQDDSIPKLSNSGRALLAEIRNPDVQPESRKEIYQFLSERALASYYEDIFREVRREYGTVQSQTPVFVPPSTIDTNALERLSRRIAANRRQEFIDAIMTGFGRLNPLDQGAYMESRMGFVHAVGEFNNRRAPISVPGRSVAERFERTSEYRQVFGISKFGPTFFSDDYGNGFTYDKAVRSYFGLVQDKTDTATVGWRKAYTSSLFPNMGATSSYANTLGRQITLPAREEAYISYLEYEDLAKEFLRAHLPSRLEAAHVRQLSLDIANIPIDAKHAYIHYQIVAQRSGYPEEDLRNMLVEFSDLDFAPIRGDKNVLSVDDLSLPSPPEEAALADLYKKLASKSQKSRDLFQQLANNRDLKVRLDSLLDPSIISVAKQMADAGYGSVSLVPFVTNSTELGLKEVLSRSRLNEHARQVVLRAWASDPADMDSLLFYLSTSIYEGGGDYAPGLFQMLILEAGFISSIAQIIVASLLYAPALLVCVLLGDLAARKLTARETLHRMMESETAEAAKSSTLAAKAVDLVGRGPVSNLLINLAKRGWSTIALAGRRGAGKSRMLQQLANSYRDAGSITVWMFAPSLFAEGDFVEDIFERLALATEATIGKSVGAKPFIVRDLEQRSSRVGVLTFAAILLCYFLLVSSLSERLIRPELTMSWIPAGVLIILSLCSLGLHLRKLQPADLTFWIEKERSVDSQLVWLYRETTAALRFVTERRSFGRPSVQLWRERPNPWAVWLVGGVSFFSLAIAAFIWFDDKYDPKNDADIVLFYTVVGVICGAVLFAMFGRNKVKARGAEGGTSLGLLVEKYRQYAMQVVSRLKRGALGVPPKDISAVVVCIDELDKIVEFSELRRFIRMVKSVFEIPGVSYYLSISEDALVALNLGASLGKNEVDSSFDHIVMVPPLDLEAAEVLANEYSQYLGITTLQPRTARLIAAMSFGIPRDIVRRCDEMLDLLGQYSPDSVIQHWLDVQLHLGEASGFFSATTVAKLKGQSNERPELLMKELERVAITQTANVRHLLFLGVLALLSDAIAAPQDIWLEITLALSAFGYGLPARPVEDLKSDFADIFGHYWPTKLRGLANRALGGT